MLTSFGVRLRDIWVLMERGFVPIGKAHSMANLRRFVAIARCKNLLIEIDGPFALIAERAVGVLIEIFYQLCKVQLNLFLIKEQDLERTMNYKT